MSNKLSLPSDQSSTSCAHGTFLTSAQEFAWSLATSLMACATLFRSESGYGAMLTAEFDGEPDCVRRVYDPFEE